MEFFFRWIGDDRRATDKQLVSMNENLGRIILYKKTVEVMKKKSGKMEITYVKVGVTDQYPNAYWIKPCEEEEPAAKKVHRMGGNTSMISAKSLFSELKKMGHHFRDKTDRYYAQWDDANQALKVDLTPKLEAAKPTGT